MFRSVAPAKGPENWRGSGENEARNLILIAHQLQYNELPYTEKPPNAEDFDAISHGEVKFLKYLISSK